MKPSARYPRIVTQIVTQIVNCFFLWLMLSWNVVLALPNDDVAKLALYLFERSHVLVSECPKDWQAAEKLEWLCGLSDLDEMSFSQRWDSYMSIRPAGVNLTSISSWGEYRLGEVNLAWAKVYRGDDGYYIIAHQSRPEQPAHVAFIYSQTLRQSDANQSDANQGNMNQGDMNQGAGTSEEGAASEEVSYGTYQGLEESRTWRVIDEIPYFQSDISLGQINSPVSLFEYSDYNCSHCQRFHKESFDKLFEEFIRTGLVRYVYRQLISSGGDVTALAANASLCASEQMGEGGRLELLTTIYTHPTPRNVALIRDIASEQQLDSQTLINCIQNQSYSAYIQYNQRHADALGLLGTPSFVLVRARPDGLFEGQIVQGSQNYEVFAREIGLLLTTPLESLTTSSRTP